MLFSINTFCWYTRHYHLQYKYYVVVINRRRKIQVERCLSTKTAQTEF